MSVRDEKEWSSHVERVVRSQHYTWLGEGLGGAPLDEALQRITTDILHICHREGISWEQLLQRSQSQCRREEQESLLVA